jgi:mannitol-1-/sugar-/sorbitol-6-phosphatase
LRASDYAAEEHGRRERLKRFECEAVLFDLDGVLVDSTPAVERVWRDWADRRGQDADQILRIAHGRRTAETILLVAPHLDAEAEASELERQESGNMEGVLEVEGARALLLSLPPKSWTVVTSGSRTLATGRMEHLELPAPLNFVTAEDVTSGKPDPEAYIRGAGLLGASPGACVAIEDAPSGIRSAKAAGMSVVAVATTHEPSELSEADAVANSLAKISFALETREFSVGSEEALCLTLKVDD